MNKINFTNGSSITFTESNDKFSSYKGIPMIEDIITKDKAFFVAHANMEIVPKAGALARSITFHHFLNEQAELEIDSEDSAAMMIRAICKIESRSELNKNNDARGRFNDLFDTYLAWLDKQMFSPNESHTETKHS